MNKLTTYEQQLLQGWEEIYKRGQLTLWIFLALQDGPKHMAAIKEHIKIQTNGTVGADDQSMYRALRRYYETELVTYSKSATLNGPDRKVYELTSTGQNVLKSFIERNVKALLNQDFIKGESHE